MRKDGIETMDKKRCAAIFCGTLLAGCLAGCGPSAGARSCALAQTAADTPEISAVSLPALSEDGGAGQEALWAERFQPYEPFGLSYDSGQNELWFDGRLVRWFEDYYPLSEQEDGAQAGMDFFNENGVVDVRALRDRDHPVRAADGSYDPSGTLIGVTAFSEEEFAARDVEALQAPAPVTAVAGDAELSPEELEAMAEEYAPFGLTYDAGDRQWYYGGEAVCFLRDVLVSNGKSLSGGGFHGVIRTLSSEEGALRIETVRDFGHLNALGYGTLTGIRTLEEDA